jgi:hypothetical protein
MTPLDAALRLRALGCSVIPVPPPDARGHDGKVPIIRWAEFQSRIASEEEIRQWFGAEPMNLAIVTGAVSDLVVVDADSRDGLRWCTRHLKYTAWQVRTSRGFHLYYRHPRVLVRNRAKLETRDGKIAVDVRGDGGYVIGPGSRHASGHDYQWAGDWTRPREDVPRFWPGRLQRPPTRAARPAPLSRPTGDVVERARRYLAAIPRPEIGAGSDVATLSAACRLVRGFALSESDAVALLWQWAGGRPGWTLEWVEAKVRHALRYGTEPIGGLA